MSRLDDLVAEAEEMGIGEAVEHMLAGYIAAARKAAEEYEEFHWGEPSQGGEIVWVPPPPVALVSMGPLISVVYEASKRGELAHWEHDFKRELPVLAYDPMAEDQLYIVGGTYRVTSAGIVG